MFGKRKSAALEAAKDRTSAVAVRCAQHLREALPAPLWAAFVSEACRDQRTALTAATATFLCAMEAFDGSPESVTAINRASQGYLTAMRDAFEIAAGVAAER